MACTGTPQLGPSTNPLHLYQFSPLAEFFCRFFLCNDVSGKMNPLFRVLSRLIRGGSNVFVLFLYREKGQRESNGLRCQWRNAYGGVDIYVYACTEKKNTQWARSWHRRLHLNTDCLRSTSLRRIPLSGRAAQFLWKRSSRIARFRNGFYYFSTHFFSLF